MTLKSRLTTTFLAALAVAALIVTVTPAEAGGTDAGTRPTGVETNQSCEAQVAEQKLSGAEKESFMEKCHADNTRHDILMGITKDIR
jgi:hypothetical protein